MKNIKIVVFVIIISNFYLIGTAQKDSLKTSKIQISFAPHYLLFKGIRLDIEPVLKKRNQHIVFAPQIYFRHNIENGSGKNNNIYENDYDTLMGLGIDIYHKYYPFTGINEKRSIYLAYGFSYNYFQLRFRRYDWNIVNEEGLIYYNYEIKSIKEDINRFGAMVLFGVQNNFFKILYIDGYIGFGIRYSVIKSNSDAETTDFNETIFDYGFTGVYIPIGFKIGIRL